MLDSSFSCYVVSKNQSGELQTGIEKRLKSELPAGNVLVRVRYSSLNYKDAMAATANPAIAKTLPHVPGIDAAGIVQESTDLRFTAGMQVIATGHELGVERWGGWADYVRVPAEWVVPLPTGLSLEESMIYGTAGFTAAQCVQALLHHKLTPASGPIVVTGATGGVGSLAVMLLSKLGFHVIAVSGKPEQADWLRSIGATEVAGRELLSDPKGRPLLAAKFVGGIDTVGGSILTNLCKMVQHRGCVACCGVTAGAELGLTVYPFILRGLTLAGIDSAWCPDDDRVQIWKNLAGAWKPSQLQMVKRLVPLARIQPEIDQILKGKNSGRVVVEITSE